MDMHFPNEGMPKVPELKFGPWIIPIIILIILLTGMGTVFYQVGPDEVGVIQRFGKYIRTAEPGLHSKIPFGIETAKLVKVTHIYKEEFGFRTVRTDVRSTYSSRDEGQPIRVGRQFHSGTNDPFLDESLMLTGDLNIAVVEWIVQYSIKDPVKFLFNIRDIRETIRNMSEAVMRLVVGDHTINQVLTDREEIQKNVLPMLQDILDSYGAGIAVKNVILQEVTPPDEVKPSFNLVNEARQEKEQLINDAWKEYNRVIPRAKGEALQKVREAEGYALQRVNAAKGDAERFVLTWEAYKSSPEVTKKRLYLEMLETVFPQFSDKYIIDERQTNLLPLLNLNQAGAASLPQAEEKGGQNS